MDSLDLNRAQWHKSSRSGGNGSCIEVARNLPGVVAVRDSKDREGARLMVRPAAWRQFTARLKTGDFHAS